VSFLEQVMKDGIIDEGKRMTTILTEVTDALERMKDGSKKMDEDEEDEIGELLLELRDIVEQIDYAKAFAAMGGLKFLLGCAGEQQLVPQSIRIHCLACLGTLCQNNPSVQYNMLELGAIRILIELYFSVKKEEDENGKFRARIVQTLSCAVRSHAIAEQIFCEEEERGRKVLEAGLGLLNTNPMLADEEPLPPTTLLLRKRSLFFLQAIMTSDYATKERVRLFFPCIHYIIEDSFLDFQKPDIVDTELREMTLSLLLRLMKRNEKGDAMDAIVQHTIFIQKLGTIRVAAIRTLVGEEREYAEEELNDWENLLHELSINRRSL